MDENERIAILEVQTGQITQEVQQLKEDIKVIHKLTTSIEVMVTEMKGLTQQIAGVRGEVVEVKSQVKAVKGQIGEVMEQVKDFEHRDNSKKARLIDGLVEKVLWIFVGGLAGYVLYRLFPFV